MKESEKEKMERSKKKDVMTKVKKKENGKEQKESCDEEK